MKTASMLLSVAAFVLSFTGPACVSAGKPASAYIQDIAIDHSNSQHLFVAAMGAGLFESQDGGESWLGVILPASIRECVVIRIDPRDSRRLLTGGEASGLWASEDGGKSWAMAGLAGKTVCDVARLPEDPDRMFVLADDGVYRTQHVGRDKWVHVFDYTAYLRENWHGAVPEKPWHYSRFQKIAIDPHNPSHIMIGARWEGGFHRSEDGGETWEHPWVSGLFRRIDGIIFDPQRAGVVYAGTHHQGMFLSCNGGKSWVSMSRGQQPQMRSPYYGAFLISGLALSSDNSKTLYTGSDYGNWKTTNGGIEWRELGKTLACEFARVFAVDPGNPSVVYAGTNAGLYKSTDGGNEWQGMNDGFPEASLRQIVSATIAGREFQFAVCEGGVPIYRREKDQRWMPASWNLHERVDSLAFDNPSGVLVAHCGARAYRSSDAGLRWDVPLIDPAPVPAQVIHEVVDGSRGREASWILSIEIPEPVCQNDLLVDSLYRRPPYVSVQVVSPGYPLDGSLPLWEGTFEKGTRARISIPEEKGRNGAACLVYVEARDFQKNVLVGFAPVAWGRDQHVVVHVARETLLPAFSKR